MTSSEAVFSILEHDDNFREIMRSLLISSIDLSFDGIMITEAGPGFPIVYVNPAFCNMTGYTPEEILRASPSILQGPATDPDVLERLAQDLSAGRVFHGRAINYRKDGAVFMMEWKIAPIRNREGAVSHFLAIQRDVSHET